ncbi:arginyl-tRNA synthetase [Streptomyces sp. WMMB 714]|uniref:DALR anticodon-binding domain-containing protein n=1 Tax=Streptomyces sp. WMMB 714 TaxID=1286822 RepID=UPI0005F80F04|nr:DALR anticodon-binding domain-containing protein [Streptomyces sp. WMMB 714]SCK11333.1 arginyl-tRNA synthetase [Streptomyces sp. WMMB 714]
MTPAQLSRTVLRTVRCAAAKGELPLSPRDGLGPRGRVVVEAPPRRGEGDYSVNVAFHVAQACGAPPHEVARILRAGLAGQDGVRGVEVTGGGFLNVTLEEGARAALVDELARSGAAPAGADDPATDIARWSAATGDAPEALAVRTSRSSALFHVQYAHARTRALVRNARDLGFRGDAYACVADRDDGADVGHDHGRAPAPARSPYGSPSARALLALLADHRRVSEQFGPARHARHLVSVGDAFFEFHDRCPPLPRGDEKPGAAHRARMALVEATGAVLAGGLSQLGVTAPARL